MTRPLIAPNNATFYKVPCGSSSEHTTAVEFYPNNSNKFHARQPEDPEAFPSSVEFNLIREEDAEILEQGVKEKSCLDLADFDDDGRRLEACASDSSLADSEEESTPTADPDEVKAAPAAAGGESANNFTTGEIVDEASHRLVSLSSASLPACPLNASPGKLTSAATSTKKIGAISTPANAEDSVEDSSCLAPRDPNADDDSRPPQSATIGTDQHENNYRSTTDIDHEALARRKHRCRSNSYVRRMHESAQFAEAVGEESGSLLLKKILDEDSSSDFDDDEIDEGEKTIKDGAGGLLTDSIEALQNTTVSQKKVDTEQLPGAPSHKTSEPGLAQISPSESRNSNPQMLLQQRRRLPQLSNISEIEDSGFSSTKPSACKPHTMVSCVNTSITTSFHPPCYVNWKFTRSNSFGSASDEKNTRHKNSVPASSSGDFYFGYRGIPANPPLITKRGMARGNYAQLHRKAWLEVSDKHHRYGKNLRMYYKHWEALGHPGEVFFDWLDSTGEATGHPLPNLPEIPREVLDADTVLYITNPEISARYVLGIVVDPTDGSAIIVNNQKGNPICTGKEGWIFVLRDHLLYGSPKVTAPGSSLAAGSSDTSQTGVSNSKHRHRFHHSSFFGGKAVASAGIFITDEQGHLTQLYPHSGHYRPGEAHMQRTLFFFHQFGVELSTFTVDMQQIFKVSRKIAPGTAAGDKAKDNNNKDKEKNGPQITGQGLRKQSQPTQNTKKSKKTDCLHLMCGQEVACFLAHKALMIEKGVFQQIHKIRRIPKESRNSACFVLTFVNS